MENQRANIAQFSWDYLVATTHESTVVLDTIRFIALILEESGESEVTTIDADTT